MLIEPPIATVLRSELFYDWLAAAMMTVGVAAIAVCVLRRRRDLLLMYFGLFTGLYGLRLGIQRELIRLLFQGTWYPHLRPMLDFLVPIPFFLFFREARLVGRRQSIAFYALIAILLCLTVVSFFVGRPYWVTLINNITVMIGVGVLVFGLWQHRGVRGSRFVAWGFAVFLLGLFFDNIVGIFTRASNIEPLGMMVFIISLGHLSVTRALDRDEKLVALESELDIARNIQRSILPGSAPKSSAFDVAARYVPMTAVAGDFYDYVLERDDQLAILIADVSGHGIPAALIASMVKLTAASHRDCADNPAAVLERMNKSLCGNTQTQFVTAALLYLDRAASCLRYSAAAHPPMLRLRQGSVTTLQQNGLMLAAFSFATYDSQESALMTGDRYVLYTDGLPEAENADRQAFGLDRLQQAVAETQHHSPDLAADEILARVQRWSLTQDDDLTLILCDVR